MGSRTLSGQGGKKPPAEIRVPFRAGELLSYDVSYSTYLTAGTVTLNVQSKRPSFNSVAYYIVAEARPTPLMSKLYTLYYKADVLIDTYTLLPQRAGVYSEEGKRHLMKTTTFDDRSHKAVFENVRAKDRRELSVPPYTQDALSAIYLLRAMAMKVGEHETIPVSTGGRTYRARVDVEALETVTTPAGTFQAQRYRAQLYNDTGQINGRPVRLWISDTPSRVPVKLQSDLAVGSFNLTLREVRLGAVQ
jgi:hypothetical protein